MPVPMTHEMKGSEASMCAPLPFIILVCQLGLDHLAVQAGDVGNGLVLGAYGLAGASVGAVTESELVHLGNHVLHAAGSLYTALRKQGELRHLRRYEEHGRAVLTSSYASTAADAVGAADSDTTKQRSDDC